MGTQDHHGAARGKLGTWGALQTPEPGEEPLFRAMASSSALLRPLSRGSGLCRQGWGQTSLVTYYVSRPS